MNENTNVKAVKKRKMRFNIVDFLLIVIALAVVAALLYVFLPNSFIKGIFADESVTIQYAIEFKGVDEAFLQSIKENDVVIDSVTKAELGTVTAIDYSTQYTELKYDEESGNGVLSVVPNKHNVIVTITANAAHDTDKGYTIGGKRIAVGELIAVRFPNFTGEGYCISVPIN